MPVRSGRPTVSKPPRDGSRGFGPATQPPEISLLLAVAMPNPQQGSSVKPDGTVPLRERRRREPRVTLEVSGANNRLLQSNTTGGAASFSYMGAFQGIDTIIASATLSSGSIASNPVRLYLGSEVPI